MANKNIAGITSEVFALLENLDAEQRQRVISATMALFGEGLPPKISSQDLDKQDMGDEPEGLGKKAKLWMKQNKVKIEQLQEIYHFEDGAVEIIAAELPGANKKEQTTSAYLICGIKELLQTDDAKVSNASAVTLCQHIGCYDKNNHTANRNSLGNKISGGVTTGFTLPAPGLKAAAEIIKSVTS